MATAETEVKTPAPARTRKPPRSKADPTAQSRRAAVLLKMVSDPTRVRVVALLADGEVCVGDLCKEIAQSQPALSHHLALLRHSGFIAPRRAGRNNFYGLTDLGRELASVVKAVMAD